jgi:arginyl-tRNA synthetase
MANLEVLLAARLAPAFAAVAGEPVDPVIHRSQHADFQADGALALARRLRRRPRDIAVAVLAEADGNLDDLCSRVEVSGPGFLNLTLADRALAAFLAEIDTDDRLGVPLAAAPEIVLVDYSAPNVAKEMHVGQLRSTVIGDAAVRVLDWLGHRVIRANHVGDWGTPFGMLIEHLLDLGETEAAHELSIGDLNGFYQAARVKFDASAEFADRSRRRVVALQAADETTRRLWRLLVEESEKYFLTVYDRLDVRLTDGDFFGESRYNDMLRPVVAELDRLGLLRDSDGAQCVFPAGFTNRDGQPMPIIVRKSDGGFGYGATDLAAIRYRTGELGATRLLYVVGSPQRQHLELVYAAAREAGWLAAPARAEHVGFGSVLGPDGKMLRTRAGSSVKLVDLLDEAVTRAFAVVTQKSIDLPEPMRRTVSRAVGIGAVKYADLSTDRIKDYVFDFDRMLALEGNTAPYLQYARARSCSILRRAGVVLARDGRPVTLTVRDERMLVLELLAFPAVVNLVAGSLEFHRLATYLYGLASTFTTFYEHCPVLRAEDAEIRRSRLVLCDLVARTIAVGLDLLGIESPDQM